MSATVGDILARRQSASPRTARASWWPALVSALTLGVCALIALQTQADPDLWGHVRYGLDILEQGTIPRTDPYSYLTTPGSWINHEWLAEVLMALAWRAGGGAGLVWLKLAVAVGTVAVILQAFAVQRVPAMARPILAVACTFYLTRNLVTVRPQMFTALCFAILLLILLLAERGRTRLLAALVPLFAFWVNAHGGFLAGVGFLGLWLLGRVIGLRKRAWKEVAGGALAVAATLANPYGLGLWRFLLATATVPRPEVQDWQPLLKGGTDWIVVYAVLLAVVLAVLVARRARPPLSQALVVGAAALLPLAATRHLDFFAIAAPIVTGPYMPAFREARQQLEALADRRPRVLALAGRVAVGGMAVVLLFSPKCPRIVPGSVHMPTEAVALLRTSGLAGDMLVPYNWGQYALWHLGPRIRVSMDGRRETVYDPATYDAYIPFHDGAEAWEDFARLGHPGVALIERDSHIAGLLAGEPGWRQVYQDDVAVILVRVDGPFAGLDPASVGLSHAAEPECFP